VHWSFDNAHTIHGTSKTKPLTAPSAVKRTTQAAHHTPGPSHFTHNPPTASMADAFNWGNSRARHWRQLVRSARAPAARAAHAHTLSPCHAHTLSPVMPTPCHPVTCHAHTLSPCHPVTSVMPFALCAAALVKSHLLHAHTHSTLASHSAQAPEARPCMRRPPTISSTVAWLCYLSTLLALARTAPAWASHAAHTGLHYLRRCAALQLLGLALLLALLLLLLLLLMPLCLGRLSLGHHVLRFLSFLHHHTAERGVHGSWNVQEWREKDLDSLCQFGEW